MTPITPYHYLVLSAALFAIGLVGVMVRRNIIIVLMSIELMLNAVNLAIVAFGAFIPDLQGDGAVIALLLALNFVLPDYHHGVLARVMVLAVFAMGYNLLFGYVGLLSLGHAMFFGMAGYFYGHVVKAWDMPPELGLLAGVAGAAFDDEHAKRPRCPVSGALRHERAMQHAEGAQQEEIEEHKESDAHAPEQDRERDLH